ncbi:uncharacterized protein LOC131682187 [Topomyia yanbarensis]|uniref:uncharacterized protein LOC131682187 n=1 Tax=Topomyia yanbarensis TaxID=2498891 RepID=UPI00273B6BB2|nr:uncharacterized protein LOC131682187 [Topomyia yanbarensis]
MMLRAILMLLVFGSAVLAGPMIWEDQHASRSERKAADTSATSKDSASAVPDTTLSSNAIDSRPETSSSAAEITTSEATVIVAEHTSLAPSEQTPAQAAITTTKPRKTITFDQRQEGKFNIRADLENFVIVVVPSSPSAGISLLDLLNRSGQKKQQKKKSAHRKGTKNHSGQKKSQHITPEVVVLDDVQSQARVSNEEFIEGRTPYKVDISSTGRSSSSGPPSPIYRVVRPFTLNVEQPTSSNMIRFPAPSGNYYDSAVRESKSLPVPAMFDEDIRTNTVFAILTNNNNNGDGGINPIKDDGTDDDNYLMMEQRTYLDLPDSPDSSFASLEYPLSDVDMMKLQLQEDNGGNGDGWELKLLGAQEQCGPDRKRDSYGVCQFVTP